MTAATIQPLVLYAIAGKTAHAWQTGQGVFIMPGVSREQIEQAKEIELLSYLQAYEPDAVKKISANEYCLKNHDSFKISNGKWNWFSRGIGGKNALTFLIKVRGMDFVDAVRMLCDGCCPIGANLSI